jgi:hypothetical protein
MFASISFWTDPDTVKIAESFGAVKLLDKNELVQTFIPAQKAATTGHSSPIQKGCQSSVNADRSDKGCDSI